MLSLHPICMKYQDENNNILRVDTSELRFGGVQNSSSKLVLKPSSLNHTRFQALSGSVEVFAKLAILALLLNLYSHISAVSFFIYII